MKRLVVLVAGCLWVALHPALSAQDLGRGQRLFGLYCAPCHGAKGEGGRGADLTAPGLARSRDDKSLFEIIQNGIPGTEMPPLPTRFTDNETRDIVAFVRSAQRKAAPAAAGNAAKGEQLYRTGNCAQCHTLNGNGGILGPDLSDIGARRGPAHLRTALLEPEAYVPENFGQYRWFIFLPDNFLQVRVVTKDGRRITGVRLNEDPFSIQIRDLSERFHSFWKSELKELHKDWGKSPMPGYKEVFTPAEIEDLVAYLASLRGGP